MLSCDCDYITMLHFIRNICKCASGFTKILVFCETGFLVNNDPSSDSFYDGTCS